MQIKNVPITKFLTKITQLVVKQMISFLAQDTISTQKMKLLLVQVRRSSGEGVEHDELNIEGLVEELEHEGARYTLT